MNEILFLVEEDIKGGYTAKAIGESIFTEGEDIDGLKANIYEAVFCHFDEVRPFSIIFRPVQHDNAAGLNF